MRETAEKVAEGIWCRRAWYNAQRIRSETLVEEAHGVASAIVWGPHREFDLDGRLVREVLIAAGRLVSRAEYDEARRADPRLPAPADPQPTEEMYRAFLEAQKSDPRYLAVRRESVDEFCAEQLEKRPPVALVELLGRGVRVIVGERSPSASAKILAKLMALPVTAYALEVEQGVTASGATILGVSDFVLRLPEDATQRKQVWRAVKPWIRSTGYETEEDVGQAYMFVRMK